MEYFKSDLEKEIEAVFIASTDKKRECEVAGVLGVLHEHFRQLATGNWSERYPTTSYLQREENKNAASTFITGFIWAMDGAGYISDEKRREMQEQLTALRFPKNEDGYYYGAVEAAQEHEARQQDGGDE